MYKTFFASGLILFTLLLAAIPACKDKDSGIDYTADADCSAIVTADNTYTNEIKAILDVSCALSGCHDAATASDGVNLSSYATAKNAFEKDEALCAIHHGSGCLPMPQGGSQLDMGTINKIDCWVINGYIQ